MEAVLPLEMYGGVPTVKAEIDGKPAVLVLDTGSDRTVLSRAAAQRLGVAEGVAAPGLRGAGGLATAAQGVVGTLGLGAANLRDVKVLVSDGPEAPLDGVIGIDTFVDYELELDVRARRAVLYAARSCVEAAPGWTGRAVSLPVQQQAGSGHLFVQMFVDGEPLHGLLDSGASRSVLSLQAAEDAGLRSRVLEQVPQFRSHTMNREGLLFRPVRFRELRVGEDAIAAPVLTVGDLPAFAGDLLLGEDYIGTRRLWFSFRLGRVWVAGG